MEKFKILLVALFISFSAFGQQYTPMTAAGYQMKRIKADSTLHIPSFCGVPTLLNSTAKQGALAMDTCGGYLYMWTNADGWDTVNVTGGSTDTTSLSNRINAKLSTSDSTIYYTKYRSDTSRSNIYAAIEGIGDTASVVKATVHNAEGTTLTKGTVVYLFGATGNVASVKRAYNTSDTFSSKTFAIVRDDIGVGQNGTVITQGVVDKLNLGSFTEGDIVWLDSIPGQFTKNKPSAPYHQVFVGVVERANNGNGQLFIKISNGFELGELHNVSVNGQADNDVLYYQSSTKLWKAKSPYLLVDTSGLSNRINVKLNASDTSSLSNRIDTKLNSADTTSLSNRISTKVNLSDSTLYQTKFRSDTARTNTYTAISGKFTLPSLTSGSVLFSDGTTIAQKNSNFFWNNTTNRLGLGTATPANTFDVVRGTAGAMSRGNFESASFSFNGDAKVGVYTSSAIATDGAGIAFAQTNLQANGRYPGFELQYVYSSTVASNAMRINYTERLSTGAVQNYTANVLQAFADGSVVINPTASGVTASAKLLVGRASSTYTFDVNGSARVNSFYFSALSTPSSATASGVQGEIRVDANYIYVCTATNTWKRVAIATW